MIPFLGVKVRVAIRDSGAKVIFKCADRTFCGVAAVGVRGTSWKSTWYLRKAFSMVWEHSLSMMWRVGEVLYWRRCLWHIVQDVVIYRACRFLRRWVWMELVS